MTQFLKDHLDWLRLDKLASKRTVDARRHWLLHADHHLPQGVDRATQREIATYRAGTGRPEPWSPWTVHTLDTHLRGFYAWAVKNGLLDFDPMLNLSKPKQGTREAHPCEDDDLARALANVPQWPWRRALMLAAYAGLRCSELCTVTAEDISPTGLVVHGKGGKFRTVPISPILAEELAVPTGCQMVAANGRKSVPLLVGARCKPMNPRILTQMQRPVWDSLGLPRSFTLHSARHWFATNLADAGVDLMTIMYLLGHGNVGTTQNYLRSSAVRRTEAVTFLPALRVEPGSSRLNPVAA